jgi:hypothetical protein
LSGGVTGQHDDAQHPHPRGDHPLTDVQHVRFSPDLEASHAPQESVSANQAAWQGDARASLQPDVCPKASGGVGFEKERRPSA